MEWYLKALKQYSRFNGRARRKEYWYFSLISLLISGLLGFIDGSIVSAAAGTEIGIVREIFLPTDIGLLRNIYTLGVLIPTYTVMVRRLHDTDRSGWWFFINLIPFLGWLFFLYFLVEDSDSDKNRFGRNPKESPSN